MLDTSVFIASETGRALNTDSLPTESAVCIVTLAELEAGVLAAPNTQVRARRLATLQKASGMHVFEVERGTALAWAYLRTQLAQENRRVRVNDLWIAANALANDLPVVTQDSDIAALHGIADLEVVLV